MSASCDGFFVLGASHHQAPIEVRETLALNGEARADAYGVLRHQADLHECLILNTCNRLEVYGVSDREDAEDFLTRQVAKLCRMDASAFRPFSFWLREKEAVEHLFQVTAGIDSQMVGETEILGQVKQAYREAASHECSGPLINKIFQKSFQAGKWARTHTAIGRGQVSTPSVAVDLARRVFGDLADCRVLLVGTGAIARDTVKVLNQRGCSHLSLAGRNLDRASEIAREVGARSVELREVPEILHGFDIIIGSTSAPQPLVELREAAAASRRRGGLPLFLLDLAMPRDFHPDIGDLEGVYLFNLDDLAAVANENLASRRAEIDTCRQALAQQATETWESVEEMIRRSQPSTSP